MSTFHRGRPVLSAAMLAVLAGFGLAALAQQPSQRAPAPGAGQPTTNGASALRPCTSVKLDPTTYLTLGKSRVVRLDAPAVRLVVGGQPSSRAGRPVPVEQGQAAGAAGTQPAGGAGASDGVADTQITLLSPTELFLLGRKTGSMNVVVQGADGHCTVKDIVVTVDPDTLQATLRDLMPDETGVKVKGAESSLVLTGTVTDTVKLEQVVHLARSYADDKKVVNLLRVTAPQQVMLEVQIAEVSKTLLNRLGLDFTRFFTTADGKSKIISGFFGGAAGLLSRSRNAVPGGANASSSTDLGIDAAKNDGIVRVLAEPNIMAISGQSASFLSGGKIFIPVAQDNASGRSTITLEEKEFGVGLRFTPTVLDGRINLKVVSEVSELSQTGSPFTAVNGVTAILPSMTTRRVDTTVQLADGQSFAVAGLIKNNVTEALNRFPGLGEAPVVGALFRSTEFQNDQTELMFVVTPRLAKPVTAAMTLPTDNHVVPNRTELFLNGMAEGAAPPPAGPARTAPATVPAPAPAPALERPRSALPPEPAALPQTSSLGNVAAAEPAVSTPVLQTTVNALPVNPAKPLAP